MEALNTHLFLFMNASAHPDPLVVALARALAEWVIWLIPLLLVAGWLWGDEWQRKDMLEAAATGLTGLLLNQLIGLAWQHPRPFMVGLGHTLLQHAADSSFPSDHLTLLWGVAFSLVAHAQQRYAGICLAVLGLPVAWARIYLGVHFPLDMAGSMLTALVSAVAIHRVSPHMVAYCYQPLVSAYRRLAGPLIQRGWIAE